MSKPKRAEFDIATREGRSKRTGYVLGDWATHKEPGKGVYFWTFTHLPTGVGVTMWPCHDNKASALARLVTLAAGDVPDVTRATLDKYGHLGWGLGMVGT
jgi:hypothetical protein